MTSNLFSELQGVASHYAMSLMYDQFVKYQTAASDDVALPPCTGFLRNCYGLPCAHDLREYLIAGKSVPTTAISAKWTVERDVDWPTWSCAQQDRVGVVNRAGCRKVGKGGRYESVADREMRSRREQQAAAARRERELAAAERVAEKVNKKNAAAAAAAARKENAAVTAAANAKLLADCPCGENPRPSRIPIDVVNWIGCALCGQWYHTICELPSRQNEKVSKNAAPYVCTKCRCGMGNHRPDPGRFAGVFCLDCLKDLGGNDGDDDDDDNHNHNQRSLNYF